VDWCKGLQRPDRIYIAEKELEIVEHWWSLSISTLSVLCLLILAMGELVRIMDFEDHQILTTIDRMIIYHLAVFTN
jgi:hypothetical protein